MKAICQISSGEAGNVFIRCGKNLKRCAENSFYMKGRFIIFFLLISNLGFAQKIWNNKVILVCKLNLTSLVDAISFPAVQISIEKKLSRYFSLSSEVGYQFYTIRHTDTTFLSPEGLRINLELRYYIPKVRGSTGIKPSLEGAYFGLRPFYRQNQYNAYFPFQTQADPVTWNEDNFGVKNETYGLCFVGGFQKSISRRLIFDFYTGLVVENRTVVNTELQYDKEAGDIMSGTDFMQFISRLHLSESSGIWGNVTFGFRVGYKFYSRK